MIPDAQVKPGVNTDYLTHIGDYIVDKKPEVIVQIGDFADMPSLSSYDVGKKSFEGRRYKADIEAAHGGMDKLLQPLLDFNAKARRNKEKLYHPRMVLTLGNHENRITRCVEGDAKLDGTIGLADLDYERWGWEVYPFLDVVIIEGIAFSHYFVTGMAGRPASTASAQLAKKHMSCIAGHQQGYQISSAYRADGACIKSIICGSCYTHDEDFMGVQGNRHYRGILVLHDVHDGEFEEMPVTLKYLKERYERRGK